MKTCVLMILLLAMKFNFGQEVPKMRFDNNLNLDAEIIGKWHNEYLDHVFEAVREHGKCISSDDFFIFLNDVSAEFFANKGIQLEDGLFRDNDLPGCIKTINLTDICKMPNLPDWYRKQFCSLKKTLDAYTENSITREEFESELSVLQEEAALEGSDEESVSLLAAISVARHSVDYWEGMAETYRESLQQICGPDGGYDPGSLELGEGDGGKNPTPPSRGRAIVGKMVTADVGGAITGAVFGGLGGPVGAVAGALVGAGSRSVIRGLFYGFTGR